MDEKTELRVLNVPRNVAHPGLDDRRLRDVVDEARVMFRTAEIRIMDNVGSDQGSFIGCQIRGPATIVAVARQWIVERVPEQTCEQVRLNRHEAWDTLSNGSAVLRSDLKLLLENVARVTHTNITVLQEAHGSTTAESSTRVSHNIMTARPAGLVQVDDSCTEATIEIQGAYGNVVHARLRVLVALHAMHNTHNQPSPAIKYDYDMEIHDWRVLVVVAGRHCCAARRWMIEAQADIYLPACVTAACVVHHQSTSSPVVSISIVGDNSGSISHAKSLISATLRAFEANGGGFAQTVTIPHRKIEYIYRYQLSALEEIMRKYAVAITLHMSHKQNVHLLGENRACVDRAVKSLMDLISKHHTMRLLLRQDLVLKKGDSFDFSPVAEKLSALGSTLAVDITISGHQLDVSGRANDLMAFGRLIQSSNFADMMIQDIHIEAQLASLYHEFITGKKNGKLNKIIKSCSVQLDLVEPSPFALLLQDELPAELEFAIPDLHHKRIIGVGGKNIQLIMKKYGVYVKFEGAGEFRAIGGLLDGDNNVVARTPGKNASNLDKLRIAIMEQAYPDFHELKTMTMHVARRHLRICQVHRRAIEGATGARMIVSSCDSIDASIIVSGSPKVVDAAIEALDGIIPANYEISCPITSNSQNGQKFVEGKEFRDVVNKIRSDLGIEVTASFQPSTSLLLTLTCTRASSQRIYQGLTLLSSLCEKHGFVISRDSTSILVPLETTNNTRPILARFPDLEAQATQPAALHGDTLRASSPANIFGGVSVSKPRSPSAAQSMAMTKFPAPIGSRATIIEKASTIVVPDIFRISPTTPTDGKSSTVTTTFDRATEQITGYQGQTLDNAGAALTPRPEQENQIRSELMQTQSESTGDKDVVGQIGSRAHRRSRTSNGMTSTATPLKITLDGFRNDEQDLSFSNSVLQSLSGMEIGNDQKLAVLLRSVDMEKHIATFAAHDVDFPMFLTLTEEDLQELGLSLGNRRKLSMVIAELRERDRQQRYLQSPVAHPHYQRAASPFQAYPPASDWAHSPFVSSPMSYAFGERARSPITGFGPGASPISIGGFDVFRGGIPYGSIHPTMTTGQIQGTEKQGPSSPLGVASTSTAYHLPVPRAFEGQRQQQSTKMHHDNDTKR